MKKLQFKQLFLTLIPFFCVCCVLLFENLSFNLFGFSQSYLSNALGVIFYFAVFRVTAFNSVALFILGLITDTLFIFPVGLSAVIFCFVFFIAQFNRPFLQKAPFRNQWLVYCCVINAVFLFGLVFLKGIYGSIPHFGYLLIEYICIVLTYPFIALFCGIINRKAGEK